MWLTHTYTKTKPKNTHKTKKKHTHIPACRWQVLVCVCASSCVYLLRVRTCLVACLLSCCTHFLFRASCCVPIRCTHVSWCVCCTCAFVRVSRAVCVRFLVYAYQMCSYVLSCLICLAARSKSCHGRLVVRLYTRTLEAATHTRKRHVCICKRDLDKCKRDLDKCKRDLRICKRDQQDAQQDKTCAQQARISLVKTMGVLLCAYQACTCVLLCAVLLYTCRGACLPSVHMRLVVCLHMCFHVCACCVRASSCGCLPGVRAHIHLVIVLSFCTDLLLGLARISCCVVHRSLVVSCGSLLQKSPIKETIFCKRDL